MCCLLLTQDAGLENMALEVGTVQGGQIAALQDGKDGALGKPLLRYTVRSFGRYACGWPGRHSEDVSPHA